MKNHRNCRVIAYSNEKTGGFDLYLNIHGRQEYVSSHRKNGLIFLLLKDGIALSDLKRIRIMDLKRRYNIYSRTTLYKLERSLVHLLDVIDEYIECISCAA